MSAGDNEGFKLWDVGGFHHNLFHRSVAFNATGRWKLITTLRTLDSAGVDVGVTLRASLDRRFTGYGVPFPAGSWDHRSVEWSEALDVASEVQD